MAEIKGFSGENEFLSNFFIAPMEMVIKGTRFRFRCSETAYQMFKVFSNWKNPTTGELGRAMAFSIDAFTPGRAKRLGKKLPIDEQYWKSVRVEVMKTVLKAKFGSPLLRDRLLATGDAYLEETNDWNDTFWGVCNGIGENMLGKLLMQLRAEIRERLCKKEI